MLAFPYLPAHLLLLLLLLSGSVFCFLPPSALHLCCSRFSGLFAVLELSVCVTGSRDVDEVIAEIEDMYNRPGARKFQCYDDNLLENLAPVKSDTPEHILRRCEKLLLHRHLRATPLASSGDD